MWRATSPRLSGPRLAMTTSIRNWTNVTWSSTAEIDCATTATSTREARITASTCTSPSSVPPLAIPDLVPSRATHVPVTSD